MSHSFNTTDNLRKVNKPQTLKPPEAKLDKDYSGKSADIWLCGTTLFHMIKGTPYKIEEG